MSESKNKRLVMNTIMLYIRMLLIMGVSLYTSRVILDTLGVEDFGIYNIVGGVISSLSLVTHCLSGASSRFITFGLGEGNLTKLKSIFSTSVNILLLLSFIVLFLAEVIGVWFLNNRMNIPAERLYAANWIFQFSLLTFIIRLLSVPYTALIVAHEKMTVYAYISILEVFLQLFVVYSLSIASYDKLIMYGALMTLSAFIITGIYKIYSKISFKECKYVFNIDKEIFVEMAQFAGWNFIGTSAGVLKVQGVDIIINLFFGVTVNAARGISSQVNVAVSRFIESFTTALKPQIIKSYANNELDRLSTLILYGSRFSFYMMLLLSLPLFFEMDFVLSVWLTIVPEYAVQFTRLQLLILLVSVLSQPLISALLATGKIKKYQITVGVLSMLCFPLSYLCLLWGGGPELTYVIALVIECVCLYARLKIVGVFLKDQMSKFLKNVLGNILIVSVVASLASIVIINVLPMSLLRFILSVVISVLWTAIVVFFIGLSHNERQFVYKKISKNK